MKYYKEYIVALLVEIATIVLLKLPGKLGGTFMCPSSSSVCEWGWTIAALIFMPLLAIVLYAKIESTIYRTRSKRKTIYQKFVGWYYSRQTEYSWEINGTDLNLHIDKFPKRTNLWLRLEFNDVKLISGITEQQKEIKDAKRVAIKRTLFYEKMPLTDVRVIKIITKDNGTTVFFIPGNRDLIAPFPGRYSYKIEEYWEYEGNVFYGKKITKGITINNKGQVEI